MQAPVSHLQCLIFLQGSVNGIFSTADQTATMKGAQPGGGSSTHSPKPTSTKMATPPPKVPALRFQLPQGLPSQRVSDSQEQSAESATGPSVDMTPVRQPSGSRPTSSHSSMSAEDAGTIVHESLQYHMFSTVCMQVVFLHHKTILPHLLLSGADIFQRLAEAEQHIVELRSRIIGLTALNADLTKKLKDEVTETTVLKALEARNAELQAQIIAANKEISGLQV